MKHLFIGFAALLLAGTAHAQTPPEPVRLLAAGSLSGAMGDIATAYTKATGIAVTRQFGSSGLLREKIEGGAPADIFASASFDHTETLSRAGRGGPAVVFVRNRFCAFARPGLAITPANLLDRMLDPKVKLMTSTPLADPSGDYAWLMFKRAEAVRPGSEKALQAKALQLVGGPTSAEPPPGVNVVAWHFNEGRADLSVGYCTSASAAAKQVPGLEIVDLPPELAVAADYGLIVLSPRPEAGRFAMFVLSPAGQAILARWGFNPVTSPGS